jgi:hypothetical protein
MAYDVTLPPDLKGHHIDVASPLYVAFAADAEKRGMTQEGFTAALTAYARGAVAKSAPAAPAAPAPAAVPPPRDWAGMTTREQFGPRRPYPPIVVIAADMAEIYHRTLGGKVTYIDAMTRDEVEAAIAGAPFEWSTSPRGFAPWPPHAVRGTPVIPPSLADEPKAWKRTHEAR